MRTSPRRLRPVHVPVASAARPRRLAPTVLFVLASCAPPQFAPPPADPAVGYRAENPSGFTPDGANRLRVDLHGATVQVQLQGRDARLVLTVDNPTSAMRTVRLGTQADSARDQALGEFRRQDLSGRPLEGGSAYVPFLPMQDVEVPAGTRVVLFVDTPTGQEPEVGEYVVLLLEVAAPGLRTERRLLPLVAAYTPPRRRR